MREATARIEAAIDLIEDVIGVSELGWLVEQLASMGQASLQANQLVMLLSRRSPSLSWGLMEEILKLLDPKSLGVPARPLAKLLSRRAEANWRPKEAHLSEPLEVNEVAMAELPAAQQLISALLCLIRAGDLELDFVADQLDSVAMQVSERNLLWGSTKLTAVSAIIEADPSGTSQVVELWQRLHLPSSATAAVAALRSLSMSEAGRLRAQQPIRALIGKVSWSKPHVEDIFRSLLAVGMGPEELRSRLRCMGGAHVHLSDFAKVLQKAGVIMAIADVLEAAGIGGHVDQHFKVDSKASGCQASNEYEVLTKSLQLALATAQVSRRWVRDGLLDVEALCSEHLGWLGHPEIPQEPPTWSMELSRLDLPPYVLFACLDVDAVGHLTFEQLRKLEQWPAPLKVSVEAAKQLCDPTAQGVVTYACPG